MRLRLHGGATVDVPSWTKAIPVDHDGTHDSLRDGPQFVGTEALRALEFLASSIDRAVGNAVVYRPSHNADFVIHAIVEGAPSTADA
ncbi:hypothetical protein WME97_18390 [Sorangium sp. So ce367]|uniref:hypothetical protein n=1 Tax=Sorangium sp. So ce367 TaxID=3133305 RepID=UPI003F642A5A